MVCFNLLIQCPSLLLFKTKLDWENMVKRNDSNDHSRICFVCVTCISCPRFWCTITPLRIVNLNWTTFDFFTWKIVEKLNILRYCFRFILERIFYLIIIFILGRFLFMNSFMCNKRHFLLCWYICKKFIFKQRYIFFHLFL